MVGSAIYLPLRIFRETHEGIFGSRKSVRRHNDVCGVLLGVFFVVLGY